MTTSGNHFSAASENTRRHYQPVNWVAIGSGLSSKWQAHATKIRGYCDRLGLMLQVGIINTQAKLSACFNGFGVSIKDSMEAVIGYSQHWSSMYCVSKGDSFIMTGPYKCRSSGMTPTRRPSVLHNWLSTA